MKHIVLYKRNAKNEPICWEAQDDERYVYISHGVVNGTKHVETLPKTKVMVSDIESRIKAKRKEGYKELDELKDSSLPVENIETDRAALYTYLKTYLPKYNTTSEGFVLPMLAKTLEDNKPFEKYSNFLGQWKIDGLRCIIGLTRNVNNMFIPYMCTYHSRIGEDWTNKMSWMDDIIIPKLTAELKDLMLEEDAKLDGELYLPGYSVNDINSFVKNTTLAEHYMLQYWCYDIGVENMDAGSRDTFRFTNINIPSCDFTTKEEHLNNKKQFILLPTEYYINDINTARMFRDHYIDLGFEGLIIRNPVAEYQFGKRNQSMFKYKKIDDGKFIIVDIIPEHKRADLPIFVCRNDINDELFECSINKPQDTQRHIFINKNSYIGKYMVVEFRARSGIHQVPFHARGIDIVEN